MNVGSYRHRVTFREKVKTADGRGGSTVTLRIVATVSCLVEAVSALKADEAIRGSALTSTLSHRIRCRFNAAIVADLSVLWVIRGVRRILTVQGVELADAMGEELFVLCSEAPAT